MLKVKEECERIVARFYNEEKDDSKPSGSNPLGRRLEQETGRRAAHFPERGQVPDSRERSPHQRVPLRIPGMGSLVEFI